MAKQSGFSKKELVTSAIETTKANFLFLLLVIIIVAASSLLRELLSTLVKDLPLVSLIVGLVLFVVQVVLQMGLIRVSLNLVDKGKSEFADLYKDYPLFLRFLGASILYGIVVFLGLLLLVVPGIYLAIRYQFYTYLILDKKLGVLDSLHQSASLTRGNVLNIFLLDLILIGINILGVLALVVGLLFTIPMTMLVYAYLYRKLSSNTSAKAN